MGSDGEGLATSLERWSRKGAAVPSVSMGMVNLTTAADSKRGGTLGWIDYRPGGQLQDDKWPIATDGPDTIHEYAYPARLSTLFEHAARNAQAVAWCEQGRAPRDGVASPGRHEPCMNTEVSGPRGG
jgi:hypothetical protein